MQDNTLSCWQNINICLHLYSISLPWSGKLKFSNKTKYVYYLIRALISVITIILLSIYDLVLHACWVSSAVPEYSHLKFTAIHLMFCHPSRFMAILSGDAWILCNETQGYWLQNRMMKGGWGVFQESCEGKCESFKSTHLKVEQDKPSLPHRQ